MLRNNPNLTAFRALPVERQRELLSGKDLRKIAKDLGIGFSTASLLRRELGIAGPYTRRKCQAKDLAEYLVNNDCTHISIHAGNRKFNIDIHMVDVLNELLVMLDNIEKIETE